MNPAAMLAAPLVAVDLIAPVLLPWPWSAAYRRWISPLAAAVIVGWLTATDDWGTAEEIAA